MKTAIVLFVSIFIFGQSIAQQHGSYHRGERLIRLKTSADDGITISLNDQYYLIEDRYAQIIRHAHAHLKSKIFFWKI